MRQEGYHRRGKEDRPLFIFQHTGPGFGVLLDPPEALEGFDPFPSVGEVVGAKRRSRRTEGRTVVSPTPIR